MDSNYEWRPVVGYPQYMVSDHGHVWSTYYKRELTYYEHNGYTLVHLVGSRMRGFHKMRTFKERRVHRLVLEAFVGPCPEGYETRHRNGDKTDNRLLNLMWGTRSDNRLDNVEHGTHKEARKDVCPFGHALAAPNLVRSALKRGKRNCLACGRARSYTRNVLGIKDEEAVRELADRYYSKMEPE